MVWRVLHPIQQPKVNLLLKVLLRVVYLVLEVLNPGRRVTRPWPSMRKLGMLIRHLTEVLRFLLPPRSVRILGLVQQMVLRQSGKMRLGLPVIVLLAQTSPRKKSQSPLISLRTQSHLKKLFMQAGIRCLQMQPLRLEDSRKRVRLEELKKTLQTEVKWASLRALPMNQAKSPMLNLLERRQKLWASQHAVADVSSFARAMLPISRPMMVKQK
mmetsp:Transcript_13082/g.25377  ORF Transcript_13082/g.25377 Transcript_13082/m.25377 type:complete len:213 (+) Transcript_13082:3497-4135(+)